MAQTTGISWTDCTWSPLVGCSKVSSGCAQCYAVKEVRRLSGNPHPKIAADFAGLVERHSNGQLDWTGTVRFLPDRLLQPLTWKKPRRIFVNSMSDLFHEGVRQEWLDHIFAVMAMTPQHTYQCLTKRPEIMQRYCSDPTTPARIATQAALLPQNLEAPLIWPLRSVWLGVSVESREHLDRLDVLRDTPAAVRFISFEPLLEDLGDIRRYLPIPGCVHYPGQDSCSVCRTQKRGEIHWGILGGESGQKARPCNILWLVYLLHQLQDGGVATWVKQLGSNPCWAQHARMLLRDRKGADMAEWPEDLRVQQFPEMAHAQ